VIHVLGLEFDEKHNGEVRFRISLFIKKLQAVVIRQRHDLGTCNIIR
jgi:hypothetical protein